MRGEADPRAARENALRRVSVCIPALEGVPIERMWSGLLDVTPDETAMIGPLPGFRDCFVAAGFSGHGFCLGPGVGRLVAEWIVDGKPSLSLHALSPDRFGTQKTAHAG